MHADYIANPLYDNNPFIEALPPMLSGKDLIHALAVIPPYSDSDRDRSTGERLQLLSSLYEFYQPLSMTIDLYCEIYTAMQHCYGQYSVQSEAAAMQNGYSLMHGNALAASIGGGNSFSVVGVSGLGKSTALQRVLSLYPQVIEHTEYHGQKFYCHQIPYLVVQTPHDASIKALILDIYLQIDSLIGTCYQKDALSRRLSIDVLVSQLNQIVRVNHIGLLVIDELQNITYHKSDGGITRICLCRVYQGRGSNMISFFPTPYPDELWYSVICRYHVHSGNYCAKHTLRQLYGDNFCAPSLMLCGPINTLLAQLPQGFLSAKDVVMQHTFYPYYARFFPTQRKRSTYAYVVNGNPLAVHRMGISQANGNHCSIMRYCPACYQEDLQLYGEPYWHRSHQLPDMQICTKHRCWLVDTDVAYNSTRQQELFPASFTMQLKKPSAEPVPGCLLALDSLLHDTLDSSFDYRDGSVYHAVLDCALRSRGWRSLTGGRTYAAKIETALLSLYGSYVPTADISTKQLHATLCNKSVAPRYVLQLAVLLVLSLHDLLHAPDAVPDYKAEMKAMYQSGASMYHIAQLYGTDAKTVARWVKQ